MEPLQPDDPAQVGPYRILARLGTGGMGVVYLGRAPSGRKVAVKVIRKVSVGDPTYRGRFRREIEAARKVTGTFTAPVLDADPDDAAPWLATAYLPGLSLWEVVQAFGRLPPEAVLALAAGLAEALAAIHRAGVVHRDLKPGNVILSSGGPRVIDFGIARPEDATAITHPGVPIGTPGFMSPEQTRGAEIGPAGDVFALGATLAYAASGSEPFGTGAAESRLYRVLTGRADLEAITEPRLRALIEDCLRGEPEHRPSAAGVLERLGPPGEDEPSPQNTRWLPPEIAEEIDRRTAEAARVPDPPPSARPEGRPGVEHAVTDTGSGDAPYADPPGRTHGLRRRTLIAGAGAGALAAGGLGALVWWPNPRPGRSAPAAARPVSPTSPPPRPAQRWKRRTGADYVELAATDDVLLALTGETVRGLDPRTGAVLWKRVHSFSPTAAGDIAYVLTDEATRIAAIRAASGRTLWTSDYYHQVLGEGMAVTGPVVCVGTDGISAVNARDGRPRWTSKVSGKYGISGADGLVVAVSSTAMTGIDAGTGRTRWTYPMDYGDYQLVGGGMAFASDRFGTLHAVHTGTGAAAWRRPDVKSWSSQVGGGLVFVEGRYGDVLALRTTTGEVAWSRRLMRAVDDPHGQATAPGLAGGTLYVACTDGRLYALASADGRLQWIYDAEKPMRIRPVSVGGLVFVATMDGYIRALVPPAGATSRTGGSRGSP